MTGEEASSLAKPISVKMPIPGFKPVSYTCLATHKTSYVGEPVAIVCAEDPYVVADALELIDVEYDPLPPLVNAEEAMKPGSPLLYEEWGDNEIVSLSFENGDVSAALNKSDHVFKQQLKIQRHTGVPLETRGCLADYDPGQGTLAVWSSTQFPHILRTYLAESLGVPEAKVRVVAPDIGGAFGLKLSIWPEEIATCLMSMKLGRPVRWIEDRTENLMADNHCREGVFDVEVGVNRDLTITAIRLKSLVDVGCAKYAPWASASMAVFGAASIPGVYKVQNYQFDVHCIVTNKAPQGAYRGFGEPESTFIMDRMIDIIAKELKVDPTEVRFRNLITSSDYPYVTAGGAVIDSGSHTETLRKALQIVDYESLKRQRDDLRKRGRFMGIGISIGMKGCDSNDYLFTGKMLGYDQARVKVQQDGKIAAFVGGTAIGQGIQTTLAQALADELGVPSEDVMVTQGDTDTCPFGFGNWASRGAIAQGGAVILAARRLRERILSIACALLQQDIKDLEIVDGKVSVKGSPDHAITFKEIARATFIEINRLPHGLSEGLEVTERYDPMQGEGFTTDEKGRANFCATYPHGTHVAVVEVDAETGKVQLVRYVAVYDCGNVINPMIVEGQTHGAIAQGIGGALYEELIYDENGQFLTSTLMDYLLPTSLDVPDLETSRIETPSPKTIRGIKGIGEVNIVQVSGAIANAVEDALSPFGIRITETPVSPMKVWQLLQKGHTS
jgi:carbon-monoxide dehydrogenase large subunit